MKKSKVISLVLVTGLLGCGRKQPEQNRLYLRTDSSGYYTRATPGYHGYYIFRPYGTFYGGYYMRQGYSNSIVHTAEPSVTRGGFGGSEGFHVSS
ncbi:hypothetical protein [Mucilaginibacter sp.]|uniref:hypothetical protein n=1 Tax=Mucilaginibacter sp. TaxID=1882438 RepID=UPI003D115A3C